MGNAIFYLLSVPFSDDGNIRLFKTESEQRSWMLSKAISPPITESTVIPRNGSFIVSGFVDNVSKANYLMYRNTKHSEKWYYAFILSSTYNSEDGTRIEIKTHAFQTNMFDISLKQCFVEREHHNPNTPNTIEEGLDIGEYVVNKTHGFDNMNTNVCLVSYTDNTNITVKNNAGIMSCVKIWALKMGYSGPKSPEDSSIITTEGRIQNLLENPGTFNILAVTMCSDQFFVGDYYFDNYGASSVWLSNGITGYYSYDKVTSIDGYIPKNKKLLNYPYSNVRVTNNNGNVINLHPEYWSTEQIQLKLLGVFGVDTTFYCHPRNYKGIENYFTEGLALNNYPQCPAQVDTYAQYISQNKNSNALNIIGSLMATEVGFVSGNAIGVASGIIGVANSIGQYSDLKNKPDNMVGSANCNSINTMVGKQKFEVYFLTCDRYHAKIIDDFLTMYGEKTNEVKTPNIRSMSCFNYLKTINSKVVGMIPLNEINEIQNLLDNGVTFWHNDNMYDYTQDNQEL